MTEQRESGSPTADPFAEVRVIDSQLQHFRNYIDLIQVFKCRICSFCSPLEHVIASHMSEVHFPRRCFLCKQCLFVFEDRSQLNSHLDSAHGTRSIAVCFGETGPYANSPPTWHVGVGRSSEDDEQLSRQSTEEQTENEPHNGRVTSSTGNLANLPDGGQMERGNSASSLSVPAEGEFLRGTPTACESRQEQVLSRGSSCNPSTTDQDLSAIAEPNPILLTQQDSSQERTSRQTSEESPYQPNAETPKLPEVGKENYIKVEPVSPVRIMCPKRRRLLQASYSGESTDIDAEGRNNSESASRHSPSVHPSQNTDASQRNSAAEEATKQSPPVPAGRGGATGRRPESVLRGLLRRQETIEDMDAEVPSDPSGEKSPPQEPQNMTRSASLTDSSLPYSRESALPRQSSEPIISHAERQGETVENKSHDALSPISVDNNNGESARKSMLHDLVSRTVPKKSERRCSEGTIFRKTGSIDETSTRQPAPRSSRQRSYSLTEGDARLPPNSIATDLSNQQASETPQEKEPSHPPMTYRPREHTRMASSFWPRYPSLVYPPFAVDNDPTKIWRSFPPYQSQASVQSEPPVPSRPHSEHGKVPMPTQMSEDSFLYNYLRHPSNMGPKRKHNPAALSTQNSADAVAPGWPGENQFADAGRVGMVGHHGVPWHHYHRGLQHHMLIRQNADDKSASPSITSTSHRPGRKPDSFIYSNLERSPSMQGGGEMRSFERRRPPMLEHGGSSESSQELVQVEDITRQVHRAISGSSGLYSGERAAVAWSDQSSGNNTSQEEQSGKDTDLKKRSRKSTFNIYREIPERKRKLDRDEEERIKSSYNADGSFDYFSLTGWKAYKCELCKKRRFKTASELEEHKRRKHSLHHTHIGNASSSSSSGVGASLDETSSSPQLTPQLSNG
ncbi:uncharacterized protein [Diadema antillarum]|uniref:uncharacterized protein n=1 Tax=Diadema antillarum TaxID=105358 RepID=UPI003A85BD64